MPIQHKTDGWYWGSKGPFKTKKKAESVQTAAYASGYKKNDKSLTKEKLMEFIDEAFAGFYGTALGKQHKLKSVGSVEKEEAEFIEAVVKRKFKSLNYREHQLLKQKLKKVIEDAIDAELENFIPTPIEEISGGSYSQNTAGNPDNIKRKRDKRKYEKRNGKCPAGQELHHTNGVSSSGVRCEPVSKNRGRKGEGGRKKVPKK